jgi:saccharopine dehydrogenase-like NADP-dependent oxidoreductase
MTRQKIVILGGGMIGSAMAMDLKRGDRHDVTVAELRPEVRERIASRYGVATRAADLSRPEAIREIVKEYDLVLGALPSVYGYRTLEAVIAAGKDYCDISFMPENALELDARARAAGVTAVVDCGIAPGVSNVMAGYAATRLDAFQSLEIYVGGLPRERCWPYDYKAGFAPFDVIEEYTRPARIVAHGRVVVKEALSEPERMDFPGVGTLEAFNTDGLRSLIHTLGVPFMKEKTLRYPGHIQLMEAFRETGLFSKDPLRVGGVTVRPLDVLATLLFPKWTFAEGEADLTVMRVVAEGLENGHPARYVWDLLDRFDPATGLRSMSRTTAFPATIVAGLMLEGGFRRPGVHAPETLGRVPGLLDRLLRELLARGVSCSARRSVEAEAVHAPRGEAVAIA